MYLPKVPVEVKGSRPRDYMKYYLMAFLYTSTISYYHILRGHWGTPLHKLLEFFQSPTVLSLDLSVTIIHLCGYLYQIHVLKILHFQNFDISF